MPLRSGAGKRYAEAIAGIAAADGSWARWRQDLQRLAVALEDPLLRVRLQDPGIAATRKEQYIDGALGGALAPDTRNLLRVMARRARLDLLPDVIAWFDELADRALGVRRVAVTTAQPLGDDQRQDIRRRLGGDGQVIMTEQVDPAILGGLVVRQGDVIQDFSVRARLEALRERLN